MPKSLKNQTKDVLEAVPGRLDENHKALKLLTGLTTCLNAIVDLIPLLDPEVEATIEADQPEDQVNDINPVIAQVEPEVEINVQAGQPPADVLIQDIALEGDQEVEATVSAKMNKRTRKRVAQNKNRLERFLYLKS